MIRIAVAAVLALAISSLARPAHAVVIDTAVTSNGEPVGGATIRVETLDGDPIRLTAVPEDHGKSAGGPAGDNTKAEVVTGKDGKLSARLDDGFRNSTVLVVVEKSGQVLMKKSVELSKDVNQVAIGVPPERLAMLPKPNAGPPGGDEGRQDAPPPAASRATLVPERTAGPPELAVAIGREGECRPGGDCCYRVTVTNTGLGPWHGPIGLGDESSFAPEAIDIERSRPFWWCSQAGQTTTCASAPLTLAKGQSSVLQQCVRLPRRMSSAVRKCVWILWPAASGPDANRDLVRLVQIALSQRGHDTGSADGLMGSKTEKSIAEFRKANALAPDGGIDQPLIAALFGDAATASGDPNSANDGACDEFTAAPGAVEAPQRLRLPSTAERPRRPRAGAAADRPRQSRRPSIDDEDDEPPPRGGPYYGPPVEMGIGIGVGRIFRGGRF